MMDLKDAKEVRKKVEEIKKKRKPTEKKINTKEKGNKKVAKVKKPMTKKEKEKQKKFRKFIWKFIVVEYIIFVFFMAYMGQIKMIKELAHKNEMLYMQEQSILKLSKTYEDCLEPIFEGDTIKITHNTFKSPKKAFDVSASDRELIAKLLYHEARGESVECQRAVVSVILNRLQSGNWGDTISEVIYAKNQFEPVAMGLLPNTKPLQTQYDVVDYVLETGTTLPSWVQYFRASYHFGWKDYVQYKSIDNTYFGGFDA